MGWQGTAYDRGYSEAGGKAEEESKSA